MPKSEPKKRGPKGKYRRCADLYLEALAECGQQMLAAEQVGITSKTVIEWRKTKPEFAEAEKEAKEKAFGIMYQEARRRAVLGVDSGRRLFVWMKDGREVLPKTRGAKRVPKVIRQYSDVLLMFLMKAVHPEYRENYNVNLAAQLEERRTLNVKVEVSASRASRIFEIMEQAGAFREQGGAIAALPAEVDEVHTNGA